MKSFLRKTYNINFDKIVKLPGYDIENFVGYYGNSKYIIKKYLHSKNIINQINSENALLSHLNLRDSIYPKPIKNRKGEYLGIYNNGENTYVVRLLSYLDGKFLGEIKQTKNILESLGSFTAEMNKSILGYQDLFISSRVWQWDIQYLHLNEKFINDIESFQR